MSKHLYDIFEPIERQPFVVDWAVGSLCNFSCSYCDPLFYEGKSPWHNFADCKRFIDWLWTNVCLPKDQILFFNLHAGEPTLWPDLDEFCEYVKSLKSMGIGSIFISHNLYHVHEIADRIVGMARGEKVCDMPKEETTVNELIKLIG